MVTPVAPIAAVRDNGGPGSSGERLTRDEAFDLLRRTVASLATNDHSVRASAVRHRARELLGRDSESLSERNFIRILKDAHDADVLNLRRRGDDFEVARAEAALPISEQLAKAEPEPSPSGTATAPRLSIRGRVSGSRGRTPTSLPPELLSLGVVTPVIPTAVVSAVPSVGDELGEEAGQVDAQTAQRHGKRGRKRGRTTPAQASGSVESAPRAAKRPRKARAKKSGAKSEDE